uniref:Uncharacterized protein n=1 Tax=Arundo donax TaxID=35708 RepID=A0A0A9F9B6_ARUDO
MNRMILTIVEQKIEQSGSRLRFPFCFFALRIIVICIKFVLPALQLSSSFLESDLDQKFRKQKLLLEA